jgi:hypothetical protein
LVALHKGYDILEGHIDYYRPDGVIAHSAAHFAALWQVYNIRKERIDSYRTVGASTFESSAWKRLIENDRGLRELMQCISMLCEENDWRREA